MSGTDLGKSGAWELPWESQKLESDLQAIASDTHYGRTITAAADTIVDLRRWVRSLMSSLTAAHAEIHRLHVHHNTPVVDDTPKLQAMLDALRADEGTTS